MRTNFVYILLLLSIGFVYPNSSNAGCLYPDGVEGQQFYNATYKTMQFCDGTTWWSMKSGGANALPGGCEANDKPVFNGITWLCAPSTPGSGGSAAPVIANVFSTDLYTGNGSTQTITNGIDLAGQGGMVWIKKRSGSNNHQIYDTARGALKRLVSNDAGGESNTAQTLTGFNNDGYSLGTNDDVDDNGSTFVAWSFREAPKFFDIVTYTGDETAGREIAHDLGITPGMVITKRLDSSSNGEWEVWHRSLSDRLAGPPPRPYTLRLNSANGQFGNDALGPSTDTNLVIGQDPGHANISGATYVAYLFAHDEGDDGVIRCGSYTGSGSSSGPTVNLGWEPQWVIIKDTANISNWQIVDFQRGFDGTLYDEGHLSPNINNSESVANFGVTDSNGFRITSDNTGVNANGATHIYCAIRKT